MDEKLIAHHMRTLKCTREEAIQLIKDDAETDKGIAHDWDLTGEQLKASKQARRADTKKHSKPTTRQRKPDHAKETLIEVVAAALKNGGVPAVISNAERTIDFEFNGTNYTFTLTAHRAKK